MQPWRIVLPLASNLRLEMLNSDMSRLHAPPSASSAPASARQPAALAGSGLAQDPLTDVLNLVRLSGALMFLVDASDPWCVDIPHTDAYRAILADTRQHVLSYHVVLEGSGLASIPGQAPIRFNRGCLSEDVL
jgi:hypothetical protein